MKLARYKPSWAPAGWSPRMAGPVEEFKARLPELKEAGNWFLAAGGFWVGDLILHELLPNIKGPKTSIFYFGNKAVWAIPSLLAGRLVSDYLVKGSTLVRALTIGTIANLILGVRYIQTYPLDQLLTFVALHEALLVPLSLLIVGPSPVTGFYKASE